MGKDGWDRAKVRALQQFVKSPGYRAMMDQVAATNGSALDSVLSATKGIQAPVIDHGLARAVAKLQIDSATQSLFESALDSLNRPAADKLAEIADSVTARIDGVDFASHAGLNFAELTGRSVFDGPDSPLSAYTKILDAGIHSGMTSKLNEQFEELSRAIGGAAVTEALDGLKLQLPRVDIALPSDEVLSKLAEIVQNLDFDIDDDDLAEFEASFAGDDSFLAAVDDVAPEVARRIGISRRAARIIVCAYMFILATATMYSLEELLPDDMKPVAEAIQDLSSAAGVGGISVIGLTALGFNKVWPKDEEQDDVDPEEAEE